MSDTPTFEITGKTGVFAGAKTPVVNTGKESEQAASVKIVKPYAAEVRP